MAQLTPEHLQKRRKVIYHSKRLGRLLKDFDDKYYSSFLKTYKPLYDYLKANLNDPSSLEVVQSWNLGMDSDSTFAVKTTFRAKNAFGALILQTINCNIAADGTVSNPEIDK
ncbi:MAG TPA: hypothetical protein VK543_13215 [Puia sp.]|nr:hypothetical protein [Puia sp.]